MSDWLASAEKSIAARNKERRLECEREHKDYWRVLQRKCNHSAFNGYHYTPSDYSDIQCQEPSCKRRWRTKARYVDDLPDYRPNELSYRRRPCGEPQLCPFRTDAPPGQFSARRFEALAASAGEAGKEAPLGAPIFACHKSTDKHPVICAGWLAICGYEHMTMRVAKAQGRIPISAFTAGEDWPELYQSYADMAEANGAYLD